MIKNKGVPWTSTCK